MDASRAVDTHGSGPSTMKRAAAISRVGLFHSSAADQDAISRLRPTITPDAVRSHGAAALEREFGITSASLASTPVFDGRDNGLRVHVYVCCYLSARRNDGAECECWIMVTITITIAWRTDRVSLTGIESGDMLGRDVNVIGQVFRE